MELESLKRQFTYLEKANVTVGKLVTDRHTQVSAYVANEKTEIDHAYDVWHVAKGIVTLHTKYLTTCRYGIVKQCMHEMYKV
jgi:hypothetical protein